MSTSLDLYSKVTDYIEKNITLSELESWLVLMLPLYLSNPDSETAILASRIELGLAEINAGITTERTLRNLLKKQFIHTPIKSQSYPYQSCNEDTIAATSTIETTILEDWMKQSPSWSSEPQVEYV
jgi:hypothetical protein